MSKNNSFKLKRVFKKFISVYKTTVYLKYCTLANDSAVLIIASCTNNHKKTAPIEIKKQILQKSGFVVTVVFTNYWVIYNNYEKLKVYQVLKITL